jgi:hypothetical protein
LDLYATIWLDCVSICTGKHRSRDSFYPGHELLVANTPDRGKVASITLDWIDPDLLRELLRRRFVYGGLDPALSFDEIWRQVAASHVRGEETSQYLLDRSLMRPRGLIDIARFCRSHAVNLRHTRIETVDIDEGEEAYSTALLSDIAFEIQDIFPKAGNVLYEFIESKSVIAGADVRELLRRAVGENVWEQVLDLLFWYGFLGFSRDDGEDAYIYSVKYDMRRLKALIQHKGLEHAALRINPAFWRALEVQP